VPTHRESGVAAPLGDVPGSPPPNTAAMYRESSFLRYAPAAQLRVTLPPQRRLGRPSRLPTVSVPRTSWWSRLLALFEPAAARERRERRAVVLPLRR